MQRNICEVRTGLRSEYQRDIGEILNRVLADEYMLKVKTFNYQYNVTGTYFPILFKMFKKQECILHKVTKKTMKRLRSVGVKGQVSFQEFQRNARIREQPGDYPTDLQMIENLLRDHENICSMLTNEIEKFAKGEIHDRPTEWVLVNIKKKHEKMAWKLRSTISK